MTIDLEKLEAALMNATKPDYELHITCPHCDRHGTTDNGEWLLWCGSEEHAQVIIDASRAYLEQQRAKVDQVPDGWVLVPVEPTEGQWGGLARDIVMWTRMNDRPTGKSLHYHLKAMGRAIPQWLIEEIPDTNDVPAKGTVAAVIYKAMIAAAPKPTGDV